MVSTMILAAPAMNHLTVNFFTITQAYMPSSFLSTTSSTFVPRTMKMIVPPTVEDIDDPEEFITAIIRATQESDLPKMPIDPRSYKIIGAMIKDSKNLDTIFVSDAYKAHLKKRGRHANQDVRIIMKMIAERYVIVSRSRGNNDGNVADDGTIAEGTDESREVGIVMSMHTNNMSKWIATKPQASISFRPLSYSEREHIVTIRYRINNKAIYVDMRLIDVIRAGKHLISYIPPNDAFAYRHVNRLMVTNPCKDTFSIRNIAHTSRDVFGSNEFDKVIKHLLDDARPINVVILTEHMTTVTSFLRDILTALFGDDAHIVTKTAACNYVCEYAKGYKTLAAEFEDDYGAPGIIMYSPHFIPAAVDEARGVFSSITVVMDMEDADDAPDDVERIVVVAEPRGAYHVGHPTYKDLRDYVMYIRNIDTDSEGGDE